MGRGDKKTKKGKIWLGSFGNARRKKKKGYRPEEKKETTK